MDHFQYREGELFAEDVAITQLAHEVGTPFYCYSTATLIRHYRVFSESLAGLDAMVCYAVKANSNLSVLATLRAQGAGADVVSGGEILRARAAGMAPQRIIFSGVGKTRDEMALALREGIFQFNVESEPELLALQEVAASMGVIAPIAIRINPDVDAQTHAKISTGKKENKFGIAMESAMAVYQRARLLPNICVQGVSMHIGSQLTSLAPFAKAYAHARSFVLALRAEGFDIRVLDIGGGLGIPYESHTETPPEPQAYGTMVREILAGLDCQIVLEPGRLIVGNAGILVSRVLYRKTTDHRTFLIVDAGMNDLMRPSLYDAYHAITPVIAQDDANAVAPVDIVGPVCESSDLFATDRLMPPLAAGDLIAFRSAGAYGASMANSYNSRLLVPEVMVNGAEYAVVRPRPPYQAMLDAEPLASWLS